MSAYAAGTHERRRTHTHPAAARAHDSDGEEFDEPSPSSSFITSGSDQSDLETHQRCAPGMLADRLTDEVAPRPVNMTLEDYQKALHESQLAVGTLRADIRQAKLVNDKLSAEKSRRRSAFRGTSKPLSSTSSVSHLTGITTNSSSSVSTFSASVSEETASLSLAGDPNNGLGKYGALVSTLGRKFGIMNELFISESSFMQPDPGRKALTALERYVDDASMANGIIAELYIAVPTHLHGMMRHSSFFHRKFLKALGESQRTVIHQLRNETATVIFGHPALHYKQGYDRSTVPEFVQLLLFPEPNGRPRAGPPSKMMPILFPNGRKDAGKIFRNESLARLLKSILFGASSLTRGDKKYSGPKPQGVRWGLKEITPGAIACAAILAIHLHSSDQQLAAIGAISKIPYYKFFAQYKQIIIEGEGTPKIASLYLFYNQIVFSNNSSVSNARTSGDTDGESSGIDDILDNLRMSDKDTVTGGNGPAFNVDDLPPAANTAEPGLPRSPAPVNASQASRSINTAPAAGIPTLPASMSQPLVAPMVITDAGGNIANAVDLENDPAREKAIQGAAKRGRKGKAKAATALLTTDAAAGPLTEPRNPARRSTRRT